MKKRVLFGIITIFLTVSIFSIVCVNSKTNKTITGETITGKLPYSTTSISVIVKDTIAPAVFINQPKNKTYHNYGLLNLSLYAYDTSLIESAWYSIDNGNNISLPVLGNLVAYNTTFNETEGNHLLRFYANDSSGNKNSTYLHFNINNSKIIVIYDKFESDETTNFDNLTNNQLENITFSLTNLYGKIDFNEPVNLTKHANTTTNEINLDEYINISHNRISLNSAVLTEFSSIFSKLEMQNLNFTNPRILKDGKVCSSSDCVIESYSSETGTLIFNVTGFSVYSAEETPAVPTPTPAPSEGRGGGGGGGGGAATPPKLKKQLEFNQSSIKVTLKQGENKQVYLKLKNTGKSELDIKMSSSSIIKELIRFKEEEFKLKANEEKEIEIEVIAKEKTIPNIYIGKVIAEADKLKEEVAFAIEVESKEVIFDVAVEIPEQFKEVLAGKSIFAKIKIYSLERVGLVDLKLDYEIRDSEGKIIASEQEMLAIETQLSLIREIKISEKAEPGEYIFYVKASYDGKIGSASESFKVIELEKPFFTSKIIIISIVVITGIFILIILYELSRTRKLVQKYREINEIMLYKTKLIKKRRTS